MPHVAPPAELTRKLSAPPAFKAATVDQLVDDDANRMKLLGTCVIENNTKADWIGGFYK